MFVGFAEPGIVRRIRFRLRKNLIEIVEKILGYKMSLNNYVIVAVLSHS